ncbi:MAG: methyltransferase domain-containing protein [Actinomycetota bacterium]|nr:methyltransferase domain-containing protein [Actinomycetota bacterium]
MNSGLATESAREAIAEHPFWYHTLEIEPGVVTPGWFDLRPIVDGLPWPDVRGKRCLDVGPYDGFLSFELERRGAAEVVAADIASPFDWDWAIAKRKQGPEALLAQAGPNPGAGFELAKRLIGSTAERIEVSAYDLTPERVGCFDVVVCGSLMLHLKDPIRALEAIHSVCNGHFMSSETIDPLLSVIVRQTPSARQVGGANCQWWIPNVAGHRRMLEAASFEIVDQPGPYAIPLGPAHPKLGHAHRGRKRLIHGLARLGEGVPHSAALCCPLPVDNDQ